MKKKELRTISDCLQELKRLILASDGKDGWLKTKEELHVKFNEIDKKFTNKLEADYEKVLHIKTLVDKLGE